MAKEINSKSIKSDNEVLSQSDNGHHDEHHHKQSFISKYIFSTDHKTIGIQYGLMAMAFLLFGFLLMIAMRLSIAYPDKEFFFLEWFLKDSWLKNGNLTPEAYNMFGANHGIIMIFFGVVPLGFAAFGNYVVPLQIGTIDMAFPKLNMLSFWLFFLGGTMLLSTFFMHEGPAQAGWTMYAPLSVITKPGGMFSSFNIMIIGLALMITSSLFGSLNFITTIVNLRCKGMTWMKLPYFVWAILLTALILLLALPPLEAMAIMQLMDRAADTSFFQPIGLMIEDQMQKFSGGGSPILFQHLFWFLGHPEVYVMLLPAFGVITEVIPVNIRKPIAGYKAMVYATLILVFLSFIVWAHHMYLTDMGNKIATFFQTTTVIISIPSVILLTCLMLSLWGGSIRYNSAMLFAVAFIPMFGIGGLTGLPLAFSFADVMLHDTYYIIGHFHYVVAPGILFALVSGIYHWFPKITNKMLCEKLGRIHFWITLVGMNGVFLPMFIQGFAGFHRRWYDGGLGFPETTSKWIWLNEVMTIFAFVLLIGQIPFLINIFKTLLWGKKINNDNPWDATTLEWLAPTPPPHGNFIGDVSVYRGPYEYSVPGHKDDFSPQWIEEKNLKLENKNLDKKD